MLSPRNLKSPNWTPGQYGAMRVFAKTPSLIIPYIKPERKMVRSPNLNRAARSQSIARGIAYVT